MEPLVSEPTGAEKSMSGEDDSPNWDTNKRLQTKRDLETTERFHMIRARWKKEDEKRKEKLRLDTTQASSNAVRSSPKEGEPRASVNTTPTERFMAFSLIPEKTPEERQREIDIANAIASKLAASLSSPTTPQSATFQRKPSDRLPTGSLQQLPIAGAELQTKREAQTDFDYANKASRLRLEQQHPRPKGLPREYADEIHASSVHHGGPTGSRPLQGYNRPGNPRYMHSQNPKRNWEYERDYRRQTYSRGIHFRSRKDAYRERNSWGNDTGKDDILVRIMNHQMMRSNGTRKVSEGDFKMMVDAQESGSLLTRAEYVSDSALEPRPGPKRAPLSVPVPAPVGLSGPVSAPATLLGPVSEPARLLGPAPSAPSLVSTPAPVDLLPTLTQFTASRRPVVPADGYSPQQPHFNQQKLRPQPMPYTYPAPHPNALGTPRLNRSSSSHGSQGQDRQLQRKTYPPPIRESLALLGAERSDISPQPQYLHQPFVSSYGPPIVENPHLPQQSYGFFQPSSTHQVQGEQPIEFSQFNSSGQSRDPRVRYR